MARGVQLLVGLASAPRESPQPQLSVGCTARGTCPCHGSLTGWGAEVLKGTARGRRGEEKEEGDLSEMPQIHLPLPLPSPF